MMRIKDLLARIRRRRHDCPHCGAKGPMAVCDVCGHDLVDRERAKALPRPMA